MKELRRLQVLVTFLESKLEFQTEEYEKKLKQKDKEIEALKLEIDNLIVRCNKAELDRFVFGQDGR